MFPCNPIAISFAYDKVRQGLMLEHPGKSLVLLGGSLITLQACGIHKEPPVIIPGCPTSSHGFPLMLAMI